jgi:hypothetical protein
MLLSSLMAILRHPEHPFFWIVLPCLILYITACCCWLYRPARTTYFFLLFAYWLPAVPALLTKINPPFILLWIALLIALPYLLKLITRRRA